MLVIPIGLRMKLLLFASGAVTLTGIRSTNWRQAATNVWNEVRMKLARAYGADGMFRLVNLRVKTIMGKAHTRIPIIAEQVVRSSLRGVKTGYEELVNSLLIRRDDVTLSIFPSSGAIVLFGKNVARMRVVYREVMQELLILSRKPYCS